MSSPTIRVAEPGDQSQIEKIAQAAYALYLPRMDRKPFPMLDDYAAHINAGHAHVLVVGNAICGYIILLPEPDGCLLLDNVAVAPECQGKKYGKALLDFAERQALAQGCPAIRLYTNAAMTENLSLYPHLGYKKTREAVQNGYKRVFFEKKLNA